MSNINFFSELKRRNVYKVAVAYAVVSWLLIQAASILFPTFDAPPWMMKVFVVVLVLGFPAALIMSWAFEITPEGIRRESEVGPNESVRRRTGRKIVALTISLGVVAAGLLAYQVLRPKQGPPAPLKTEAAAAPIPEMSIAVLPFDNLSHDPENAYFSEGIQDEILTRLAKIAQLKVISRTSTQRFKSSGDDLRQIAQQLGVANILEGSVQKVNDQVRVNVQLIKAANDAHLWAEVYDRKLTDIFAVESEIAKTVAEMLQAKLTGSAEHVLASRPTQNPEAYQLYLKGRYFWNRRTSENLNKAIELFQQALEKDPAYALAYAGLADSYALLPVYSNTAPRTDIERAIAAAHRAIELDDSLAEAHTSLGNVLVDNLEFAAAEVEFRRAISLNPNYATAHQWFGEGLAAQGRFAEALAELQLAHDLDPLSLIINTVYGSLLNEAGYPDKAVQQLHKTLEMDPGFSIATFMLGQAWEEKGDLKQAEVFYANAWAANNHPIRNALLACVYVRVGKESDARKIRDELTNRAQHEYVPSYALALVELALGAKEKAMTLLEKAYDERGIQIGGNTSSLKIDKRLDALRGDPRFERLLAKFMGETR
jgi:TolB-like protein/Tfp pilus assembly protein PilF